VLIIVGQGFACLTAKAKVSQPRELVGRWARLGADTAWSDTIELLADGRVSGSARPSVTDSTRWSVVQSRFGLAFCAGARSQSRCQPFRLEGDTLVLGRVPTQSYLRRTR